MTNVAALDWLMQWYQAQCDGDWEHGAGVVIETLDNPGWSIKIDLNGTPLDGQALERLTHDYKHATEWWTCWTQDNQFHGAGGPQQLGSIIGAFRAWAERP